jgi:hypothetical protein
MDLFFYVDFWAAGFFVFLPLSTCTSLIESVFVGLLFGAFAR